MLKIFINKNQGGDDLAISLFEYMLYSVKEDKIKKIMEEIRELRDKVNKGEIDLSEYEKMANEF